jgi:hypothetical protein
MESIRSEQIERERKAFATSHKNRMAFLASDRGSGRSRKRAQAPKAEPESFGAKLTAAIKSRLVRLNFHRRQNGPFHVFAPGDVGLGSSSLDQLIGLGRKLELSLLFCATDYQIADSPFAALIRATGITNFRNGTVQIFSLV